MYQIKCDQDLLFHLAADPYDDSIIWWGTIKEGEPPTQIVEDGEYFVLKRIPDSDAHGGH